MKKVIQLTEADLTRIVKRVLRENEEQKIADEVANLILTNISKEELMTLGQLYNTLGEDEFRDAAEDAVDKVIDDEPVNESLGFSKGRFTVTNQDEKNKFEATKVITQVLTSMMALITGGLTYAFSDSSQENIDAALVTGVLTAALAGANLLTRIPHKISAKPLPEKLRTSRMKNFIDTEMKKLTPKSMTFEQVLEHFEKLGFPDNTVEKFILNWADDNNVTFKEEVRKKRTK